MAEENVVEDVELDAEEAVAASDDDFEVVIDDAPEEEAAPVEEEAAPVEEPEAQAEEAPVAEAAGDEEEPEIAAMSDKVKKRFQREKRLRDQIIQERDQIRQAAAQVVAQVREKDNEIITLKRQYATVQKQYADTLDYAYEQSIQNKAQELRKAREDGNYDSELKAQGELDQLRFQQNQVRDARRSLPDPESIKAPEPQAAAPQQQQPAQQVTQKPPSPLAVKWLDANKAWFNSPKFEAHRDFVLRLDRAIIAEGYDPQAPEYYRELDRRIDASFPQLRKKPAANTGSTPPVAAAGTTRSASAPTKKGVVRLTRADLANMQRFGLDPTKKEHLREYARNRAA